MEKFIRVNMKDLSIKVESVPEKYLGLGGRGLTSQIVYDEVEPTCEPLGKYNKLVISPGLLTGTTAPSSGRLSVGAKSPLTGGIKESNSGGTAAQKLARLGIRALIIEGEGATDKFYILRISKDGQELLPADEVVGMTTYKVAHTLQEKYGKKAAVVTIGPAGEMKMAMASVAVTDMEGNAARHAGRGGLGAVMGAKGLKAIVLDDTGIERIKPQNPEVFREAARSLTKALTEHPITGQGLPTYGTAVLVNIINEAGALPTRNFTTGRFDRAEKISGETLAERAKARGGKTGHPCHGGCVIKCSNAYHNEKGEYVTSGCEYETIWGFGANCEIDDLDAIAEMDRLCDEIGIDTIETGTTMGVAMEGGLIPFGDAQGIIRLLKEEILQGTVLGRVLGQGTATTGKVLGVTRVPVVKGQSIPAYDPRSVKGNAVTYATSPMGADHTAGYGVTANILNVGGKVDPLKAEGQIELSRNLQIATAAVDSLGFCLFIAFAVLDRPEALDDIARMVNAQYGLNWTVNDIVELGKNVLKTEVEFNKKAGFTAADDRLPEFFREEKLAPHDTIDDIKPEELDSVLSF